jgi:hypothetical protein
MSLLEPGVPVEPVGLAVALLFAAVFRAAFPGGLAGRSGFLGRLSAVRFRGPCRGFFPFPGRVDVADRIHGDPVESVLD